MRWGFDLFPAFRGLETESSVDRIYRADLVDEAGVVHAEVDTTVYIRPKDVLR